MRAERALKREVFKELGVFKGGKLSRASNPEIHAMLRPFENAEYPLNRFHDYSRVPWEHIREWVNFEKLEVALRKNEKINALAEKHPTAFNESMENALNWRAIKAYEEEWKHLSGGDISQKVVAPSGGMPAQANEANARNAANAIKEKLAKKKTVRVVDLGCGGGGTIIPVIEKLSPEERGKVEVHLVDVMGAGLRQAKRELKKRGVKKVKTVKTNFYDLSSLLTGENLPERRFNPLRLMSRAKLRDYTKKAKGKADVVISGAALHHASDMQPIFNGINEMLSKNGELHLFDWGHYRTSKQTLDLGSKVMEKQVPTTDGSGPSVRDTVFSMTDAWMGLFGYGEKTKSRMKLRRDMARSREFNFIEWIKENKGMLKKEAPKGKDWKPFALEGHRLPSYYARGLKLAGLKVERVTMPFSKPGETNTGNLLYLISARKK
jgi:SAM-dependent methyltransferase